ncbi:hypothetical protein HDU89_003980 [Geranomyces variabilis]|nr:hypothetical protein HDU89_003980 [Geranomyces variabilis]
MLVPRGPEEEEIEWFEDEDEDEEGDEEEEWKDMVREAAQRWLEACGWRPEEPLREGGELLGGERAPKANDPQNAGLGYGMASSSSPPSPDMPDLPDDDEGFRRIANFRPSAKAAGTATPRATVRRTALRPASPLNAARSGYYRTVEWVRPAASPSSSPSPRSPLAAPLRALAPAVVRPPPPPPRAAARPLALRPARPAVAALPMASASAYEEVTLTAQAIRDNLDEYAQGDLEDLYFEWFVLVEILFNVEAMREDRILELPDSETTVAEEQEVKWLPHAASTPSRCQIRAGQYAEMLKLCGILDPDEPVHTPTWLFDFDQLLDDIYNGHRSEAARTSKQGFEISASDCDCGDVVGVL